MDCTVLKLGAPKDPVANTWKVSLTARAPLRFFITRVPPNVNVPPTLNTSLVPVALLTSITFVLVDVRLTEPLTVSVPMDAPGARDAPAATVTDPTMVPVPPRVPALT